MNASEGVTVKTSNRALTFSTGAPCSIYSAIRSPFMFGGLGGEGRSYIYGAQLWV